MNQAYDFVWEIQELRFNHAKDFEPATTGSRYSSQFETAHRATPGRCRGSLSLPARYARRATSDGPIGPRLFEYSMTKIRAKVVNQSKTDRIVETGSQMHSAHTGCD